VSAGSFRAVFGRDPEFVARAPGRIEFLGNHTDYNGGTALGVAIDRGVEVALARRSDGVRRFASEGHGEPVVLPAGCLDRQAGASAWINYPLGVLATLPWFGLGAPAGFDLGVTSDLPAGAGLGSSAALELASALVFLGAVGREVPREQLARLARQAENEFVGVPCGLLDQAVSALGQEQHLVRVDFRGPSFSLVPLPPGAHCWIFNPPTRHALADGLYAIRHRECQEAARALGVPVLADATAATIAAAGSGLAPVHFRRACHVVMEIGRVAAAASALRAGDLPAVGRLLNASHQSSQKLLENSTPELDFLAETLAATPHVFGARLTGGGFGGAVLALTDAAFGEGDGQAVAVAYRARFGATPDVLRARSADGAALTAAP
jgi:galactokinase